MLTIKIAANASLRIEGDVSACRRSGSSGIIARNERDVRYCGTKYHTAPGQVIGIIRGQQIARRDGRCAVRLIYEGSCAGWEPFERTRIIANTAAQNGCVAGDDKVHRSRAGEYGVGGSAAEIGPRLSKRCRGSKYQDGHTSLKDAGQPDMQCS